MTSRTLAEWLEHAERTHVSDIEMGLDRVREIAARLNLLDTAGTRFVIIAGTNGKGSTTLALEALLRARGFRVGATLSPHVHRFNERVRIDATELEDDELAAAFQAVDDARGDVALTYFEFSALVALWCFRAHQVDVALLEVGLGGRLDAFNIIDADIAVVTSIGLDHQAWLGDDLEQIGREKAGVFRPGQRVVLGEVTDSVRQRAAELGCEVAELGRDFSVAESADSWDYAADDLRLTSLPQGPFAARNWALAIRVVSGITPLTEADVNAAIGRARLPGRMERWRLQGREVLLDVAHNPAAARLLAQRLTLAPEPGFDVAILGMLRDKDPAGVVQELNHIVSRWILVSTPGVRGMTAPELERRLDAGTDVVVADSIDAAFSTALSLTRQGDGILALGSFVLVEESRNWLHEATQLEAIGMEQG